MIINFTDRAIDFQDDCTIVYFDHVVDYFRAIRDSFFLNSRVEIPK